MTKHIYLVSGGGIPNYGDELIGKIWVEYLTQQYPEAVIWLDTKNAGWTAQLYADYPHVKAVDTFWRLIESVPGDTYAEQVSHLANYVDYGGSEYDTALMHLRSNVESIHFIGGGYLNTLWVRNLLTIELAIILKAYNPKMKLFGTGLGLTPIDIPYQERFKQLYEQFHYIESRDQVSSEALQITSGLDDVWLAFSPALRNFKATQSLTDIPQIMLLLQEDFNETTKDALLDTAVKIIQQHPDYHEELPLGIAFGYEKRDKWLYEALAEQVPNPIRTFALQELLRDGFPANPDTFWITSRFHFHLVGSALGSNGVILQSGAKYYEVKHQSLLELGTGWQYRDVTETFDETVNYSQSYMLPAAKYGAQKLQIAQQLYT